MYHNISQADGFNTLAMDHFQAHLQYLKASSFEVVGLDQYLRSLGKSRKQLTITFDDAYCCLADSVGPLLQEYGFPFTVYVPVNFVGDCNRWDADRGQPRIEIMDWSALKALGEQEGVTIGAHGMQHISLGGVNRALLEEEILEAQQILKQELGREIKHFSFPFGQWKDLHPDAEPILRSAGYQSAVSTLWDRHPSPKCRYRLGRIEVEPGDDVQKLRQKIEGKPDYRRYKQVLKTWLFKTKLRK